MEDMHRRYLSIFGQARVLDDRARIRALWKEPYRAWFPGGPDDRDAVLIAVAADYAEFWDTSGVNKLKYLFEAAKAYASGIRPEIDEGEQHGRTRL
jgi:general stress protein 26